MAGKWIKALEVNDWGSIITILGKIPYSDAGTVGIDDCDDVPKLTPGTWKVKWADGETDTVKVVARDYTDGVDDMGAPSYSVHSKRMFIVIDVHGSKSEIPAVDLGVKFWVEV